MLESPSVTHRLCICQTPSSSSAVWGYSEFSKVHAKCLSQADMFERKFESNIFFLAWANQYNFA